MNNDNKKETQMGTPLEKHDTASWANIDEMKSVSNVPIPNDIEVLLAKEWVDDNEK